MSHDLMHPTVTRYRVWCVAGHVSVYSREEHKDVIDSGQWTCNKKDKHKRRCGCELAYLDKVKVRKYQKGPTPVGDAALVVIDEELGIYKLPPGSKQLRVSDKNNEGDRICVHGEIWTVAGMGLTAGLKPNEMLLKLEGSNG